MELNPPQTGHHPFRDVLMQAIQWADLHSERSLQQSLGPSEIGIQCMRQLGYRLAGTPPVNLHADPWFAVIGTAVHDWLAYALDAYQRKVLGRTPPNLRWLIERRVDIHPPLVPGGKTDVYDLDLEAVIDYKVVGADTLRKAQAEGPSQQYRVQAHTYGRGWEQAGRPVREVVIVFLPRSNFLAKTYVWSEPYDRSVADQALARVAAIDTLRRAVPVHQLPTSDNCTWCPYHRPHRPADDTGCPGVG